MMRHTQRIDSWMRHCQLSAHTVKVYFLICAIGLTTGCRSLAGPVDLETASPVVQPKVAEKTSDNPIAQVSGETPVQITPAKPDPTLTEKTQQTSKKVLNFVTGREQENSTRAKDLYKEADALFRKATTETKEESVATYRDAAKLFKSAGEAAPGTALEQDAMYMQGESLFFADRLREATEVYETLQKDFPRNRHLDRVAARLFSISQYWIDTVKADDGWFKLNLTDPKKPRLDTDGHAIRVLDQIRYDDPTGRLADDATMAAAAEYIRQKKYEDADEFLTDLRETFSDSEHLFLAHLLGIRCKLEIYAGPAYSGLVLEEADTLVRQTRERFPNRLAEPNYGDMVARAAAEIAFMRAERHAYRAEYREKQKKYGAARV
ncbi:MAG: tetratricopeptide repeat protein, partial [Rubripirellula sp.]